LENSFRNAKNMNVNQIMAKAKFSFFLMLDSSTHRWPLCFNASSFRRMIQLFDASLLSEYFTSLVDTEMKRDLGLYLAEQRLNAMKNLTQNNTINIAEKLMLLMTRAFILPQNLVASCAGYKKIECDSFLRKQLENKIDRHFLFLEDEWKVLTLNLKIVLQSTNIRITCKPQNSSSHYWRPVTIDIISSRDRCGELLHQFAMVRN
jgi:hypothetical protein